MPHGRGEIRVPLAVDDNGRDYSARIEAQVTDASSREVSGNTVVHATHGSFLLTAQVAGYVFRPGAAGVCDGSGARLRRDAPGPGAVRRLVLEHFTYPRRLLPGTHAN